MHFARLIAVGSLAVLSTALPLQNVDTSNAELPTTVIPNIPVPTTTTAPSTLTTTTATPNTDTDTNTNDLPEIDSSFMGIGLSGSMGGGDINHFPEIQGNLMLGSGQTFNDSPNNAFPSVDN